MTSNSRKPVGLLSLSLVCLACNTSGGSGSGGGSGGGAAGPGGSGGGTGTPSVVYDANGATGGSVPIEATRYGLGQTVTVLGNTGGLTYPGYTFVGWQTKADGSGKAVKAGSTFTLAAPTITLYALWAGGFAYAVDYAEADLSQYFIGPNGTLTPMFTPHVGSGGADPRYLAVDPAGTFLYTSNITADTLGQFSIAADGELTPLSPATVSDRPVPTHGTYPSGVAVHPSGLHAYVANNQLWSVSQYDVVDGGLTPMDPPSVDVALGWPMMPIKVAVHPSGQWLYTTCGGGKAVGQFNIGNDGKLAAMSPPTVASGENAWAPAIATTSTGDFLYVTDYGTGKVWQYRIGADGTLTSLGTPVATGASIALWIAVHPSGKWAYVSILMSTPDKVIAQFDIGSDGQLSPMAAPYVSAGGTAAAGIAIEASGKYAYATSGETGWGSSSISQFTIDQASGALTLMPNPTVPSSVGPVEIVTVGR